MSNAQRFWDRIAKRYARTPIKDEATYEHKLAMTREHLNASMRLLELGCGTGGTAIRHAPFVGEILATDVSGRMVAIGRERAHAASVTNVLFQRAALEEIPVEKGPFDMVLALSLLHLVEDRDVAIEHIHNLLKPGGLFVSNTACLAEDLAWLRYLLPIGRVIGLLPLVRFFSEHELIASLKSRGFDIEYLWAPEGKGAVRFVIARRPA